MNHATFKASLFMAAGIIDHETGTRDIRRLSGLWRFMPITATLAMVAAAAMAGVPLLNGFLSKEMFFAETIEIHDNSLVDQALPYIVTLASMFTVAYSLRFIRDVFFGPAPTDLPRTPHEPPFLMRFPAELLVLACLVVGIVPAATVGPISRYGGARRARRGDPGIQPRRLARLHPRAPDEHRRDGRGVAVYFCCAPICSAASRGRRCCAISRAAHFRPGARRRCPGGWPDGLESVLGTRRLQPQLQLLAGAAFVAALAPLYARGLAIGASPRAISTRLSRWSGRSGSPAPSAPPIRPSFIALRR